VLQPNPYKGKLIVVEGIDGSGKSTQINLLYKWLQTTSDREVYFSEWNSSKMVKSTTRLGKKSHSLTPTTFSLIQATDFADRWENLLLPLIKAGVIVMADRYAFTAFARDVARGVDPQWVRNLYSFAFQPDIAFYFSIPLDVAVNRILSSRAKIKFYEAGKDLGLSKDTVTCFQMFQERILNEYEGMSDEFGFTTLDGNLPLEVKQRQMRDIVIEKIIKSKKRKSVD
jgi:dTMP kinase